MKTSYKPGTFLHFHEDEFQRRLDEIEIPGIPDASWDRRAAYLLWLAEDHDGPIGMPELPKKTISTAYREKRVRHDDLI